MASKDNNQQHNKDDTSELEEFVAPEVIEVVDKKSKTKRGRPSALGGTSTSKDTPSKKKPLTDEAVRSCLIY